MTAVVGPGLGQAFGHQGNLPGARHPQHGQVLLGDALAPQTVQGALQQAFGDKGIKPAHHQGEFQAGRSELAFYITHLPSFW